MRLSNHAKSRLKQRCGFNKKAADRMSEKAFHDGIRHSETKGQLRKWTTALCLKNPQANNIRLYGDKAYIFCDEVLVTVLQIPPELMRNYKRMLKNNENIQ